VPDVSIVIPTYNRCSFLKEAVASCFEENDNISLEVVIVDDGSTDGTQEWINALNDDRITYLYQENRGPQAARNTGLEAAAGEAIKFLDSDDYLYPGVLTRQWRALRRAEADVCYGPIDIIDGEGKKQGYKPNPAVEDLLAGIATGRVTTYPHVFLYRTEVARRECWQTEVPFHQDTAYALDVAAHDPNVVQSDAVVGVHRVHQGVRVTTTAKAQSAVQNTEYSFDLLDRALRKRKALSGETDSIKKAVAKGLWRQAHKLAPADFRRFRARWRRIRDIDPRYYPPRSHRLLKFFDYVLGPVATERLINPVRVLKNES